jgi:hypothetical protein
MLEPLERFCKPAENFLAYADLCAAAWLAGRLEGARGAVKVRMALFAPLLKGRGTT